jgi:hypothetical protein
VHAHVTVQFNGLTPERLYYVDAEERAHATGQPTAIDARAAIEFRKNEYERAEVELTNVPSDVTRHDNSSWNHFYWEPFRAYLKGVSSPADFGQALAQPRR